MVLAIWLAIVLGFGIDIVRRAHGHALSFPLVTHLHVVAYTGWLVLLAAGLAMRRNPAAHKRLMIMGTIALTEPGFSRIWLSFLEDRLGEGYLPFYVSTYIGTFLLVIAVGLYDLATRRRLHPAYVAAALWIFANEALADWLFHQPFWLAAMKHMTGHPA